MRGGEWPLTGRRHRARRVCRRRAREGDQRWRWRRSLTDGGSFGERRPRRQGRREKHCWAMPARGAARRERTGGSRWPSGPAATRERSGGGGGPHAGRCAVRRIGQRGLRAVRRRQRTVSQRGPIASRGGSALRVARGRGDRARGGPSPARGCGRSAADAVWGTRHRAPVGHPLRQTGRPRRPARARPGRERVRAPSRSAVRRVVPAAPPRRPPPPPPRMHTSSVCCIGPALVAVERCTRSGATPRPPADSGTHFRMPIILRTGPPAASRCEPAGSCAGVRMWAIVAARVRERVAPIRWHACGQSGSDLRSTAPCCPFAKTRLPRNAVVTPSPPTAARRRVHC